MGGRGDWREVKREKGREGGEERRMGLNAEFIIIGNLTAL